LQIQTHSLKKNIFPIVMVLPALLIIFGVIVYPMLYAFVMSFCSFELLKMYQGIHFIGLQNYIAALKDPNFINSIRLTFKFLLIVIPVELVVGIAVAMVINSDHIKGKKIIRGLIIVPIMITPIVVGLMWLYMFDYDIGIVNYLLTSIGIPKINWLGDVDFVIKAVSIAEIWQNTPFVILLVLAGLEGLPREPYESALVDGANAWTSFLKITLPLLKPVILVALLLRTIDAYRVFGLVLALTNGGPGTATEVASMYVYKNGFKFWHIGYSSALSFLMLFIVLIVGLLYLRFLKVGWEET
jgi:multiple sugar transport system permease protein